MAKASDQEIHESTAEQAKVVHVQSKKILKKCPKPKIVCSPLKNIVSVGILPTPKKTGIVFRDHAAGGPGYDVGKFPPLPCMGRVKENC